MPRKFAKKGLKKSKSKSKPRRRLNFSKPLAQAGAMLTKGTRWSAAAKIASMAGNAYSSYKRSQYQKSKRNYDSRIAASDNITPLKPIVIGVARKPGFDEQVARVTQKPIQFCRNYQWSAEGFSGRKAHFIIEFNKNISDDLLNDIDTYKSEYFTNTATADAVVGASNLGDMSRYYIDYQKESLNFMNSSSNALTAKMTLYVHKRDNDNVYGGSLPINPVALMMYYSTTNKATQITTGSEQTVGNGFAFDSSTANANYLAVFNMPGSSISSSATCASTDPTLSPSSHHVREGMDYWFTKVASDSFSLKPGQQVSKSITFNDLPQIFREQTEFIHIAGISYVLHVEFIGQIVGDGTVTTGDGVVSTGTTQLSCTRNSVRIIGCKNKIRSKVVLRTAPRAQIALAQQLIINPDTGVADTGVKLDT